MKLNCIAIDDEPLALQKIKRFASKVEYLNLKDTFDNALDSLYYLKKEPVDLIFLDIQMEEFTGFDLLHALKHKPYVILTTAYENYSLQAFNLDVSDYLLKPIAFERFVHAVEKVYDRIKKDKAYEMVKTKSIVEEKGRDFIFVRSGSKDEKIFLDDILYIEGLKDYLMIITEAGKTLTLLNFKSMLDMLPEKLFVRVHRSYIVNLSKIERIDNHKIRIGEKTIPISNSYRLIFKQVFAAFKD